MAPRSRSSSLSSLSSVESEDENTFKTRTSNNAKPQKKQLGFEVVIDNKLSPAASSSAEEYESFQEKDLEGNGPATENRVVMNAEGDADDDEEIIPDHYYGGGKIPVFKPTMKQFESFKKFVDKINHHGMKSGIVKIIAPKEWLDALPALDDKVKDIKIKNPIVQHINGNSGTFRQENVEKQRTYNLPEWRKLCEAIDHQPPAKRGERRLGQVPKQVHKSVGNKRGSRAKNAEHSEPKGSKKGSTPRPTSPVNVKDEDEEMQDLNDGSPAPKTDSHGRQPRKRATSSEIITDSHGRQPRRRRNTRKSNQDDDYVDDYVPHDSIWDGFDYRIHDTEEYTPERCEELEKAYWRSLTYNSPLYGADMPGSLFDHSTTSWNVAKLENLLDCLGQNLPGVNTAYLYLGMWKSTFAWHLEDCDLYSINYIHFGAPKQWYSISQEDASKFEQVMKNIWPQEARKCDQFLRHKTFLVSPTLLQQNGIRVNRLVHNQGEFVITFPYGYHSGYNLGYNCAESVNFATESWLNYGKIAKKCRCIDDAVWVDVEEIERRLRGEVTEDEYEYAEEEMADFDAGTEEILTPPESVGVKPRKKRQKVADDADDGKEPKKRIRRVNFKINVAAQRDHCILCPNDMPTEEMLPTDNGKKAHRLCAIYTPETYFVTDPITGKETIYNIDGIQEARLQLRCVFCKIAGRGACLQCTAKKCIRGYHATCAAAAGVLVELRDSWVEDPVTGKYVKQPSIDFQCKYHRPKRDKNLDGEALEEDLGIQSFGRSLIKGDVIQMQFYKREIFAGVVVENRFSEGMVVVDVLPKGGLVEVEWKWILATDLPSPEAHPSKGFVGPVNGKQPTFPKSVPEPNDPFCEGHPGFKWAEFVTVPLEYNPYQDPVKPEKNFWFYLGEQSTEAIAKYTSNPDTRVHDNEAVSWMSQKAVRVARPVARQRPVAVPPPPPPPTTEHAYQNSYYHPYQVGQQNQHPQHSPPTGQWPPHQHYPYYPPHPQQQFHSQQGLYPQQPQQLPHLQQQPHSQQAPTSHPQHQQQSYPQSHSLHPQQLPHANNAPPQQTPHMPPSHPQYPTYTQHQYSQYHWYPTSQAGMSPHPTQNWCPPNQRLPSGYPIQHSQSHPQKQPQPQHQQPQQASRPVAQMGHTRGPAPQLTKEQQLQQIQQNQQRLLVERPRQMSGNVLPFSSPQAQISSPDPLDQAAPSPQQQQQSSQVPAKAPTVSVDTPRTMPVAPLPIDNATATATTSPGTTTSPDPRIPTPANPLTAVGSS